MECGGAATPLWERAERGGARRSAAERGGARRRETGRTSAAKYEVAGFVWWQGHKDQNPAHAGRYEQNLVRLIQSLRKDFDAPKAKVVLATGCGNPGRTGFGLQIAEAQLAVGDAKKHPEFAGNVKCVEARDFWRDVAVSPKNQGHHYNRNAETFMEVGNALGWAMAELLKPQAR